MAAIARMNKRVTSIVTSDSGRRRVPMGRSAGDREIYRRCDNSVKDLGKLGGGEQTRATALDNRSRASEAQVENVILHCKLRIVKVF